MLSLWNAKTSVLMTMVVMHLSASYIATFLRDSGLEVDIRVIDSNVMDWGWKDYELYLREEKPSSLMKKLCEK